MFAKITYLYSNLGLSISAWADFIYYNYFSRKVLTGSKCAIVNCHSSVIDLRKGSEIHIGQNLLLGKHWTRGSNIETRLLLNENASLIIPQHYTIHAGSFIDILGGGKLVLYPGFMNEHVQVTCGGVIEIGEGTAIGRDVVISNHDGHSIVSSDYEICEPIRIGKHVWIGQGAVIRKGVTIGDGAVVASYSVVTKNVPPRSIVAGIPAKIVKENVEWK